MNKNLKRNVLLIAIIVSIVIIFVPIYIFVLADSGDDNKFRVINKKIVEIVDGTAVFDADDSVGNDSSNSNNRVRTFDSIAYTVEYTLAEKEAQTTSGNVEGRNLLVEVLVPTAFEATLKYGDDVTVYMNDTATPVTKDNNNYYYASFYVPVSSLGTPSTFDFSLEDVNTTDITNYNSIKPLIFVKESTDQDTPSIANSSSLPSDITCEIPINVTDPNTGEVTTSSSNICDVTITGKEEYFVNLYAGTKKLDKVPIGIIIGLRNQGSKGIKGLIIPNSLSFAITNSNPTKLTFDENTFRSYKTYQDTSDYRININENSEMPVLENGTISGTINDDTVIITVNDIKNYLITQYSDQFYYFSTNYFVSTLTERGEHDYSDITITLSGKTTDLTQNINNSNSSATSVQILDTFNYVLGNYSSYIDIYESSLTSGDQSEALEYGKATINYGSDFTLKTSFNYSSLADTTGSGLTSLTNYIKIDNDVFKLINHNVSNRPYSFASGEETSLPTIKLDVEETNGNSHEKVYFGFGEWNSNYFEIANNAPSNCPSSLSSLSKEQLMNLYGGPCIVEKSTVKWAYSPVAENDVDGNPLEFTKGPLIVKSVYVSGSQESPFIEPGSAGTIEVYGSVIDDYSVAKSSYQIVTSATAYGKNSTDFRYLDKNPSTGESLLTNKNNFVKTNYDFTNREVVSLNSNSCSNLDFSNRCPVSGATILVSGIKVTKPVIKSHKSTDLSRTESNFYYYPLALTINANASKSDDELVYDTIYVDLYLPSYMVVIDNFGVDNEKVPTSVENTNISGTNYKIYHYVITSETQGLNEQEKLDLSKGILSNFTVYADIDAISTPNRSTPEIFTKVDFAASKHLSNDGGVTSIIFNSTASDSDRTSTLNRITLYNSSAVITKASSTPKNIEKNGSYTFTMLAYNHSSSVITGGYAYPTADLYYVLPYNGDLTSSELGSKIGTTTYTVNFTSDSISSISNISDYKFYYATSGIPANIIGDEIRVTSDVSAIWNLWEDPTEPVSNVLAIKVVKQTPFAVNTYFGSDQGLTVNIETVNSSEGNNFYNSFHLLASKPDNYTCDASTEEDEDDYCAEAADLKINYASSSTVTSVYAREISGYVFEDYDYNGIYTNDESKLKDIPVSLYKIDEIPEGYDSVDPSTFVKETDTLVGATVTGENGNYYFGGLASGNYYVSFTINNNKYIVTDLEKIDETIPNSNNNNSTASLLPNTNKAVTSIISFPRENQNAKLSRNNVNLGLAIKKEMAISLNKYITEVKVSKNGKVDTYDYSNQNKTQVSINVVNPKNTTVQVKYSFSVENTKYYPGYIGMIVDNMPEGMTFDPNLPENQDWVMYDNLLYYNGLSGKLILPNEKQYFTLVLDLELKQAGTYRNIVSARDITLMGDELPVYDFSSLNNTEGGE